MLRPGLHLGYPHPTPLSRWESGFFPKSYTFPFLLARGGHPNSEIPGGSENPGGVAGLEGVYSLSPCGRGLG